MSKKIVLKIEYLKTEKNYDITMLYVGYVRVVNSYNGLIMIRTYLYLQYVI